MPTKPQRSPCPIACTLDLLGDKWTLLVIRDLLLGRTRYKDFLQSPEGISTNILANRLARLVNAGLVESHASPDRVGAVDYKLTAKGKSLAPIIKQITKWGLENLSGTAAKLKHYSASTSRK